MNRKVSFLIAFPLVVLPPIVMLISLNLAMAQEGGPSIPAAIGAENSTADQWLELDTNVGTSFTYQGRLTDGGNPANGTYDFQFALFDTDQGGAEVGTSISLDDVPVSNGLFTAELDFWDAFDGTALWLEIRVRQGSSTGNYTTLSPRQAITAVPYALSLRPGAVISGTVYSWQAALTLKSSGGGLEIESGDHGVQVISAGNPSSWGFSGLHSGFVVNGAEDDGLYIGNADSNGVNISTAGYNGMYIYSVGQDGVFVYEAGDAGLQVDNAVDGVRVGSASGEGFQVNSAAYDGVYVGSAGDDGFDVNGATSNGIEVSGANNYAGHFTGDIYVSGSCTGCALAAFGVNTSDQSLKPGDPIAILGVLPSQFSDTSLIMEVGPVQPEATVVGVVQGRAEVYLDRDESGPDTTVQQLVPREGAAHPGNYLTIIIYGPMQVRVQPTAEGIQSGTRLTVDPNGLARPLQTVEVNGVQLSESASILGIALEAPTADGLVWVLVNPH